MNTSVIVDLSGLSVLQRNLEKVMVEGFPLFVELEDVSSQEALVVRAENEMLKQLLGGVEESTK